MLPHSCCLFILFLLQKCVLAELACKATETVAATEGEEAILQVNRTGITEISWIFKGHHIATTRPNQPIEWKSRQFMTRLGSKPDASLIINNASGGDQGTYTVDMRGLSEADDFIQCYNLSVYRRLQYEDLNIHHHTVRHNPCDISVTCSVKGDPVIGWRDQDNKIIEGATISLYNISTNLHYTCYAENPISKVHRAVDLLALCKEERHYTIENTIRLALSVCILATALGFLLCHMKKDI